MPALSGFLWLISYWLIGEVVIYFTALPISSGVVGVFFIIGELAGQWSAILIALLLGTLLSVVTTLWLLKRLIKPTHVR